MELSDFKWISILLPFFLGLIYFKRLNKPLKVFYLYVVYGTLNEVVSAVLVYSGIKNTMPLINLYQIITFPILVIFYLNIINRKILSKYLIVLIILFEVYYLINLLFIQGIFEYPLIPRTFATFVVIVLSLIYFHKVMIETKITSLWSAPTIWINAALLIYYSGNLFFTVLFNLILEYSREFSKLTVNYFITIMTLFYIFIAIGFWKVRRQKKGGMM